MLKLTGAVTGTTCFISPHSILVMEKSKEPISNSTEVIDCTVLIIPGMCYRVRETPEEIIEMMTRFNRQSEERVLRNILRARDGDF